MSLDGQLVRGSLSRAAGTMRDDEDEDAHSRPVRTAERRIRGSSAYGPTENLPTSPILSNMSPWLSRMHALERQGRAHPVTVRTFPAAVTRASTRLILEFILKLQLPPSATSLLLRCSDLKTVYIENWADVRPSKS
jgi:hypothetical protein